MAKNKGGRPTVMTPDVLAKLEDAFLHGLSDKRACQYAGISVDALYAYQEKFPEFSQRKESLKLSPDIIAQVELVKGIKGNLGQARWWAEHKMSDEFSTKTTVAVTDGLDDVDVDPEDLEAAAEFSEKLKQNVIKRRLAKKKP